MGPRWLRRYRRTAPDVDAPAVSELSAIDALDEAVTAFAQDVEPFDEAAGWAKIAARVRDDLGAVRARNSRRVA